MLVGHGTIRECVVSDESGHDRKLTEEEMHKMKEILRSSMKQGAFGLSTGLEYPPGCYVSNEEIIELSKEIAPFGGLYASHMRDEARKVVDAVKETLTVGEQSKVPVQISHLKACARQAWDKQDVTIELIEEAKAKGMDVAMDVYPYTAYSTMIPILLPNFILEGQYR
jgi:N-acyl-D-amino-acid deacylase